MHPKPWSDYRVGRAEGPSVVVVSQLDRWLTARRPLSLVAATVAVRSGGSLREARRGGEPDDRTGSRRGGREAAEAGRQRGSGAQEGGVAEGEDTAVGSGEPVAVSGG